ncbi:hypothetical protein ACJZ2D_008814 [Fusarium nematophilum]
MVPQRSRSVPPEPSFALPPSPELGDIASFMPALPTFGPASSPITIVTGGALDPSSRLIHQADDLAKMTLELGVRTLATQAQRLKADVQKLVLRAANHEESILQNEDGMTRIAQEFQAIKARVGNTDQTRLPTRAEFERLERETNKMMKGFKGELGGLRELMKDLARLVDRMHTSLLFESQESLPSRPALAAGTNKSTQRQASTRLPSSPEARIEEAVNSTKRWNREHKVTRLPEAQFIADYLKKQGQRDPSMARLLQRSIQKRALQRIKAERQEEWSPRSLEEFCQGVSWQEVVGTAKDILVYKRERTLKLLM